MAKTSGGAEFVFAEIRISSMRSEDQMNVTFVVHHQGGLAVVIHFVVINGIGRFPHRANSGEHWPGPFFGGVVVCRYIGVFVRALVGDVSRGFEMLSTWMLQCGNRFPKSIIGEIIHVSTPSYRTCKNSGR